MAGLLIFILLSFALFYYLTRIVWVRIIKGEEFIIELHLPIFAIYLIKRKDKGDNNKKAKKWWKTDKKDGSPRKHGLPLYTDYCKTSNL